MKFEGEFVTSSLLTFSSPVHLEELRSDKGLSFPSFGNPAIKASPDPWLCVPASQRVCLFREGVLIQINLQRFIGIDLENLTSPKWLERSYQLLLNRDHYSKFISETGCLEGSSRRNWQMRTPRFVILLVRSQALSILTDPWRKRSSWSPTLTFFSESY